MDGMSAEDSPRGGATARKNWCGALHYLYVGALPHTCTMPVGHLGDHEAWGPDEELYCKWTLPVSAPEPTRSVVAEGKAALREPPAVAANPAPDDSLAMPWPPCPTCTRIMTLCDVSTGGVGFVCFNTDCNNLLVAMAPESPAVPAPEETPLCEITSDDLEALSHGLTLLGEMSRLTRNPEVQNDSISVHWHEKDGERAGAAFAVLWRIYQAHRAALATATDVGLRQIALAAKVAMLRAECTALRASLEEEKARLDWLHANACSVTQRDEHGTETEHDRWKFSVDDSFREFLDQLVEEDIAASVRPASSEKMEP